MRFVPVMWTIWGALAAIILAIYIYRASLERDEADQIFLDDSFEQERIAQASLVAKVNKIEPALRRLQWAAVVATLFVAGYYMQDFVRQFK